MSTKKRIVALIGSTRGKKTTSESVVNYIISQLALENLQIEKFRAYQIYNHQDRLTNFVCKLKESDLLLICSPLYIDELPYPLLSLMESIAEYSTQKYWNDKEIMAIIHSGYPEVVQRETCLDICHCFAEQAGFSWLGGIGFGGTSIINGKPLEEMGAYTRNMEQALKELSKSIANGQEISRQAYQLSEKNPIPVPLWILRTLINLKTRRDARKNGLDIMAQPYKQ